MRSSIAFFAAALALALLILGSCGKGKSVPSETLPENPATTDVASSDTEDIRPDYMKAYETYVDGYEFILNGGEDAQLEGSDGIVEAMIYYEVSSSDFGYSISDISGDDVPELIISSIGGNNGTRILYAVYTFKSDKIEHVLSSTARNRYYLLSDGRIMNEGSAGAEQSILGTFSISEDCTKLTCLEFYFTDAEGETTAVFKNTTGAIDTGTSEKTVLTNDSFLEMGDTLRSSAKSFQLTPFSSVTDAE